MITLEIGENHQSIKWIVFRFYVTERHALFKYRREISVKSSENNSSSFVISCLRSHRDEWKRTIEEYTKMTLQGPRL